MGLDVAENLTAGLVGDGVVRAVMHDERPQKTQSCPLILVAMGDKPVIQLEWKETEQQQLKKAEP